MTKKITPAEYEQWLHDHGRGIVALEPYQGRNTKIAHRCANGHIYNAPPKTVKASHALQGFGGCKQCHSDSIRGAQTWTKERCMASAGRYRMRAEWAKGDSSAYQAAHRYGWAEECCAHMAAPVSKGRRRRLWTLKKCMESASRFGMRKDWERGDYPAYRAAHRRGWLELCCEHMNRKGGHNNNALYCWVVTAAPSHVVVPLPGYHLVKSGVTSKSQGARRPLLTMHRNKVQGEIIGVCAVSEDGEGNGHGLDFEEVLHSLGVQPVFPDDEDLKLDGYTEFRLVSDAELESIRKLLGAVEQDALALAA